MTYEQISKLLASKEAELQDEKTGKVNYPGLAGTLKALLLIAVIDPTAFKQMVENAS